MDENENLSIILSLLAIQSYYYFCTIVVWKHYICGFAVNFLCAFRKRQKNKTEIWDEQRR